MISARARSLVFWSAGAVLLALLLAKAITVFLSSVPAHELSLQRRLLRETGKRASPEYLIREWKNLSSALFWSPGDADLWYQLGRDLHRIAVADVVAAPKGFSQEVSAYFSLPTPADSDNRRDVLLTGAIAAYERAIAANQLAAGARFWRLAARDALAGAKPEKWESEIKPAIVRALASDPNDSLIWRTAGEMALAHNDPDTAVRWFKASLALKLDGLEPVVEAMLKLPDGANRLTQAVPENAEAWKRVARILYTRWRFFSAMGAFERAMRFSGTTAIWPPEGESVADGDFTENPERLLHPWRVEETRGVKIARQPDQKALTATFRRGPANWYHVWQEVPVEPGRSYRLSAVVKVEGFAPNDTFGVEVVHPYEISLFAANARCFAASGPSYRRPDPASDGRFVTVETTLTVPDGVRMLIVRPRRFGGDENASGTVAFRAVSLRRLTEKKEPTIDPS